MFTNRHGLQLVHTNGQEQQSDRKINAVLATHGSHEKKNDKTFNGHDMQRLVLWCNTIQSRVYNMGSPLERDTGNKESNRNAYRALVVKKENMRRKGVNVIKEKSS